MNTTQAGWTLLIAALGMMCTLLSGDVAHLEKWSDMFYPGFVAGVMTHFGALIAAFVGGKLLPGPAGPMTVSDEKRAALDKVGV